MGRDKGKKRDTPERKISEKEYEREKECRSSKSYHTRV